MKISTVIGIIIATVLFAMLLHVANQCASRGTYDAQYQRIEGNQHNRPMVTP